MALTHQCQMVDEDQLIDLSLFRETISSRENLDFTLVFVRSESLNETLPVDRRKTDDVLVGEIPMVFEKNSQIGLTAGQMERERGRANDRMEFDGITRFDQS